MRPSDGGANRLMGRPARVSYVKLKAFCLERSKPEVQQEVRLTYRRQARQMLRKVARPPVIQRRTINNSSSPKRRRFTSRFDPGLPNVSWSFKSKDLTKELTVAFLDDLTACLFFAYDCRQRPRATCHLN